MGAYKVLLYDKDDSIKNLLEGSEISIDYTSDFENILKLAKVNDYDSAILNPDMCGPRLESLIASLLSIKVPALLILNMYDSVETVIDGLSSGGFDYFPRPGKIGGKKSLDSEINEVISKIYLASTSKDKIIQKEDSMPASLDIQFDFRKSTQKVIIIGSSTGGPQSLDYVIPIFPKGIPAPIIVVQHMPPIFTKKLAERLDSISNIKVKEAEDGEELEEGVCYVAKGDYHLELKREKEKTIIKLNQKGKILGVRPCINVTMDSASKIYKNRTIGVVLTGMGKDGTVGSKKIKESGGTVIVQSEITSIIYGMPKSVVSSGYYDAVVDLPKIPVAVLQVLEV